MCGRLSMSNTRLFDPAASRSAITEPANPAPTTRLSKGLTRLDALIAGAWRTAAATPERLRATVSPMMACI